MLWILTSAIKHLNLSGILRDLYFHCNGCALIIILGIGTQLKCYVQEEETRFSNQFDACSISIVFWKQLCQDKCLFICQVRNSYNFLSSVRRNTCTVPQQLKVLGKRCGRKSWTLLKITRDYAFVVMDTMIPRDIAQSKLINFLTPRGYFRYAGPLCNKKNQFM